MERWVDIQDFEGYYQVSNYGRVRSLDREVEQKNGRKRLFKGCVLSHKTDKYGYSTVTFCIRTKGVKKSSTVHRLVAVAFVENVFNKPAINHIDGDKSNNNATNLEWVTNKENTSHAIETGLMDINRVKENMTWVNKTYHSRKVRKLKDGMLIGVYRSITEAASTVTTSKGFSSINSCCKGDRKQAYGFQWEYANEREMITI